MPHDELHGDTLLVTPDSRRSDEANRLLAEALRDAVGARDVEFIAPGAQRARRPPPPKRSAFVSALYSARILLVITFVALLVVAAIVALSIGEWWVVAAAVLVHAIGTTIVVTMFFKTTGEVERPDPGVVARLEELGVVDAEQEINDRVTALRAGEGETAAEQSEEWTPASGANPKIDDPESYERAQHPYGRRLDTDP